MQMRRPKLRTPARRAAEGVAAAPLMAALGIAAAPLMAALGIASAVITALVALGTVSHGRLPADGSIGILCALVLAAVAAVEASRPARVERVRRRIAAPLGAPQDEDVPTASRWR